MTNLILNQDWKDINKVSLESFLYINDLIFESFQVPVECSCRIPWLVVAPSLRWCRPLNGPAFFTLSALWLSSTRAEPLTSAEPQLLQSNSRSSFELSVFAQKSQKCFDISNSCEVSVNSRIMASRDNTSEVSRFYII